MLGIAIVAIINMMATTINSSKSVNPFLIVGSQACRMVVTLIVGWQACRRVLTQRQAIPVVIEPVHLTKFRDSMDCNCHPGMSQNESRRPEDCNRSEEHTSELQSHSFIS